MSIIIKSQAYGGQGGSPFDDKQLNPKSRIIGIKGIQLRASSVIDSIQVTYRLVDGKTLEGPKHGTSTGGTLHTINLEDNEEITGISGTTGRLCGIQVVEQLTFYTARGGKGYRVLGPYGSGKHENPFQVVGSYHQVVAFFGRSGLLVDQIGIHYKHV